MASRKPLVWRLCPGDDTVEMAADHFRHLLHWFDLRAHDVGCPLREHVAHDIDLLALQNLAQLLLAEPGACRALGGRLRDECVQIGAGIRREAGAIPQEFPAQALDRVGVTPFSNEQHPAPVGIGHQRDVIMPARLGCLIGGQARDFGKVRLRQPQFDISLADRHHLMPGQAPPAGTPPRR